MAFDFAAGVSALGNAVSDTAGKWTLQNQRDEAEKAKLILADELAGKREAVNREWQSGENTLNRSSSREIAMISADASIRSAGISAGATIESAKIRSADAREALAAQREENEKGRVFQGGENEKTRTAQREENERARAAQSAEKERDREHGRPLLTEEVLTKRIANDTAQRVAEAKRELQEAGTDPVKQQAAKQKLAIAEYSATDEMKKVSLYQAQAKQIENEITSVQARLVEMQRNPTATMTPEGKALAANLERRLKQLESERASAVRAADEALKSLPGVAPPTGTAPDLNKYLRNQPGGLINQSPPN